jgi:hypothetical protein
MFKSKLEATKSLLYDCHKAGYHMVTIGHPDPKNLCCRGWETGPFSIWGWHPSFDGRYNSTDPDICTIHSIPLIWDIIKKYGINGSCGNGHQYQLIPGKTRDTMLLGTFDTRSIRRINNKLKQFLISEFTDNI